MRFALASGVRKRLAAGGLALALGLGGVAASAVPASAAPWNCPISGAGNSRSTYCFNGSGEFRVAIHCINRASLGSTSRYVYGPWMPMFSKPSGAWCEWYEYVGAAWAQTR
jgi:hypothetical protein